MMHTIPNSKFVAFLKVGHVKFNLLVILWSFVNCELVVNKDAMMLSFGISLTCS